MPDAAIQAGLAADWWTQRLADDTTRGVHRDDLTATVTTDQEAAFRVRLADLVEHRLLHDGSVVLDTLDGGPCALLDDAMSTASIPGLYRRMLLPLGLQMTIDADTISVTGPAA